MRRGQDNRIGVQACDRTMIRELIRREIWGKLIAPRGSTVGPRSFLQTPSPTRAHVAMPKLAHHVFFTLNDRSETSVKHLISEARKYLTDHDGLSEFNIGVRDKELDRPVNGDFDVSLHMVFADRPAHDVYQTHPRHLEFIEANKEYWAGVNIFDSTIL